MQSWRVAVVIAVLGLGTGVLSDVADAAQTGKASYYKHGKRTANGERFNPHGYTAAHRTLPFGTRVLVTNLKNGKSVIVRINDRGPFSKGRVIDLSLGAAEAVGLTALGVTQVKLVPLGKAVSATPAPAAANVQQAAAQGEPRVLVPPVEPVPSLQ